MIKDLIDFDGNKLSRLFGWVCFLFHKNEYRGNLFSGTTCIGLYASSEFRRNNVALWVLFRMLGMNGVCLRKRWASAKGDA